MPGNRWTDTEKQLLKTMCDDGASLAEMADALNRTEICIRNTVTRFGYQRKMQRLRWSPSENKRFMEDWEDSTISMENLCRRYKRSPTALKTQATRLGLSRREHDTEFLIIREIVEEMNVSKDRVMTWIRNGLPTHKSKVRPYKYLIDPDELLAFLKDHPDYYDASKVSHYLFYEEPVWFKEKRVRDRDNFVRKMGIHYTKDELDKIKRLFKRGFTNKQIADEVKRTPAAIEHILAKMGLSRRRYNQYEIDFIRENADKMTIDEIARKLPIRTKIGIISKCEQLGIKYHSRPETKYGGE